MPRRRSRPAERPSVVAPPAPVKPVDEPGRPKDAAALAKLIDAEIDQEARRRRRSPPSPRVLRRGVPPPRRTSTSPASSRPPSKARAFLDSTDPDKRAKLIDELLARPELRPPHGRHLDGQAVPARLGATGSSSSEPLVKWLEEQFNANTPWDKFVSDLVTATGTVEENPAVTYFLANRSVDKLTDSVSQHFLGMQLQCAQCHNHPFTDWKQTEYWGMAAFFSKVQAGQPEERQQGRRQHQDRRAAKGRPGRRRRTSSPSRPRPCRRSSSAGRSRS